MNMQTKPLHARHTADATTAEEGLAIQEEQAKFDSKAATETAMQNTLLTPRFYTTDFDELDAIDGQLRGTLGILVDLAEREARRIARRPRLGRGGENRGGERQGGGQRQAQGGGSGHAQAPRRGRAGCMTV